MKATLRYFSGTGNSYRVIEVCKDVLIQSGYEVDFDSILSDKPIDDKSDLIGFCCPVYAYGIPRIATNYLKKLPVFKNKIKSFVIITAGKEDESGYSTIEGRTLLNSKNLDVVYADVVEMPGNWTVAINPPNKEKAQEMVERGLEKANRIITEIVNGSSYIHEFNYPIHTSKFIFYKDFYLFKYLGLSNMWRNFRTEDSCNGCATCMDVCPTKSIKMNDKNRPVWSNTCEQCMRCVNYCSHKAIYQSNYGTIRENNHYYDHEYRKVITTDSKKSA